MEEVSFKKCCKCDQIKPITQFHKDTRTPDKHKYSCAECDNTNRKALYHHNYISKAKVLLRGAKLRASKTGKEFTIDIEWLIPKLQAKRCEATGISLDYSQPDNYSRNPWGMSLDRRDNSRGYTKENTWLVCNAFNMAKSEFDMSVFEELTLAYWEHKQSLQDAQEEVDKLLGEDDDN